MKLLALLKLDVFPIFDTTIYWMAFTIDQFGRRANDIVKWWPVCSSYGNSCPLVVQYCSVHYALVLSICQYLDNKVI